MGDISGIFEVGGTARLAGTTFTHPETGCVISADARIDYRDSPDAALSDAELILNAYLRWGEDCLDHLLGDFAFGIWDPRAQKLICARDHFGMRPLYYHHAPRKRFVFASNTRDLFQVPEVPYAINQGRVADFLVPELEWIDYTSTFFEGVYRLPPGHKLIVTPENLQLAEYWSPAPGPKLPDMLDHEYREGFLEVFTRAVDERLQGHGRRVGSMLSGGMDSGSIAAIANELLNERGRGPLCTVSAARKRGAVCDESRRIYATIDHLGSLSTVVDPEEIGEVDHQLVSDMAEPFDGEFLFMKAIFLAAREQGFGGLLDGGAGDIVLNEGAYINRMLRQGHIANAYREVMAIQKFWGKSGAWPALVPYAARAVVPEFAKRAAAPYRRRAQAKTFVARSLIHREFAEQADIYRRCERMWSMFPADWIADAAIERVSKIRPNVCAGRERYGRLAASAGVESADPFLDLNVIAYCSRLPAHLLLRGGWPKFILRDAMRDKLPDDVRWGPGKPHIGWVYNDLFLKREKSRGNLSKEGLLSALDGFTEPAKLKLAWAKFETGEDSQRIHSAYILSLWLEQSARRPIVNYQGFG